MPYDTDPAPAFDNMTSSHALSDTAPQGRETATSPQVYAMFEALNGELTRQKVMFDSQMRRQREETALKISKLEMELQQRDADCKSLQHSVTILGRSLDTITEALERVAPNLGAGGAGGNISTASAKSRGRSPAPRSGSSQRQSSPRPPSSATRAPSPRGSRAGSRPPSPDARRSNTPRRDASGSTSPATLDHHSALKIKIARANGPVPVIQGKKRFTSHKGATPADTSVIDYQAGIRYPRFLQSSIYPPEGVTDDPSRSSQLPQAKLELKHIYGCNVEGYNDNLFYGASHKVVTYSAAVGITVDCDTKEQGFCFHHTSEVCSLAMHPQGSLVATGQKGSRSASGTASTKVCVWDIHNMSCKAALNDFHDAGVTCMAFSPDGALLAVVAGDAYHTLTIYRWATKEVVADVRLSGESIYNVTFNPFQKGVLMAVGRRTVKFVEISPGTKTVLKVRSATVSKDDSFLANQRVVCSVFLDSDTILTGTDAGSLLIWKYEDLTECFENVHKGGVSSVRVVRSTSGTKVEAVVSAGRDGFVRVWQGDSLNFHLNKAQSYDVAELVNQSAKGSLEKCMADALRVVATGKAPVRSMDVRNAGRDGHLQSLRVACVLFSNQIVELDLHTDGDDAPSVSILAQGHSALPNASLQANEVGADVGFSNIVGGIAAHPKNPFAVTVGSDCTMRFWNTITHRLAHIVQMPGRGLCIDISRDGSYIAVGLESGVVPNGKYSNGGGLVFKVQCSSDGEVGTCKLIRRLEESEGESAYCVRFDPASKRLALGGALGRIDLYDVSKGCTHVGATSGHNSEVLRVDWAADGQTLQTDDKTPEHMYFDRDGSRITRPVLVRAQPWGRWTCAYGWHVQGIWEERMDSSSITAVDRIADSDLVVVGDVSADVRLFSFPSSVQQSSHKKYRGHSDEITGVAFNQASTALYTCASDGCVFQWNVTRSYVGTV